MASLPAATPHFKIPISNNFKFSFTTHFLGASTNVRLNSLPRLPRFRNLAVFAVKDPGDGIREAKSEAATGVVTNSEENDGKNMDVNAWYGLGAGLAALGFAETSYLTIMNVTGNDVYCPVGGCGDVLNSSYASVFGIPLSLIGMAGYGVAAVLGLQLSKRKALFGVNGDKTRWIFLGTTSSMTAASAYFMYLLTVKLEGASCAYCVASALLSLSLLLIAVRVWCPFSLPNNGKFISLIPREVKQVAGIQISIAALVIAALSTAYSTSNSALAGRDIDLPPVEPVVTTESSPIAISLAKYLHSMGAKLYGAFWCSHCYEQKQMFGAEASKILDYVECYPDGLRKGVKMAKACEDVKIQGFPTWIIKDQVLSGEQVFAELARVSGFDKDQASS